MRPRSLLRCAHQAVLHRRSHHPMQVGHQQAQEEAGSHRSKQRSSHKKQEGSSLQQARPPQPHVRQQSRVVDNRLPRQQVQPRHKSKHRRNSRRLHLLPALERKKTPLDSSWFTLSWVAIGNLARGLFYLHDARHNAAFEFYIRTPHVVRLVSSTPLSLQRTYRCKLHD